MRRFLIGLSILAFLHSAAYLPFQYMLVRFRMSEWYLQVVDDMPHGQIELVRLRFPHSVVYVRTGTQYVIRHSERSWLAVFSELPLSSIGCTIEETGVQDQQKIEYLFDTEEPHPPPRAVPLVFAGDVKMMLTPRQAYYLPDDLPPGWIAIQLYQPDVQILALP
jgi:hypothetical protein